MMNHRTDGTYGIGGVRLRGVIPLILGTAFAVTGLAGIPEPGARLYGTVALNGVVVTAAESTIVVEARKTPAGPAIASYRMGSQANAGNFYSLHVHGESAAPLSDPENVVLGSTLYLVVRNDNAELGLKTFVLSERGLSARVDFGSADTDADGMSDAFELANFGSATGGDPNGDPDNDGRPNYREFLQGTHPNVADGRHPADLNPADDRITLQEVTDYILAWKTGGTWPIEPALSAPNIEDYVTRAGALWKGGEVYVFDNDPVTTAPLWWVNPPPPVVVAAGGRARPAAGPLAPEAAAEVTRLLPASYRPNQPVAVTVQVTPVESTRAYAVVETPPPGWAVRNLSHEGRWDATLRKIKWGPFFDQTPRTLQYQAVPDPAARGSAQFAGRGSFDGHGFAAAGPVRVWPPHQTPPARLEVAASSASGVHVELRGEPGRRYELQASEDLAQWSPGAAWTLDGKGQATVPASAGVAVRFFRLRPLD